MSEKLTEFSAASAGIAEMAAQYMPLTISGIDDADGFIVVHKARMVVKNKRVEVEKVRKTLKADALAYGREVDGEAKRITAMLLPIETHLKNQEDAVNAEKERIRNAERLRAEAEAKAKKEAEDARIRAELEAATERLRADREKLESEQADLRESRSKMEVEKKAIADAANARQRAEEIEMATPESAEGATAEMDVEATGQKGAFMAGWMAGRTSQYDGFPGSLSDWEADTQRSDWEVYQLDRARTQGT